MALKFRIKCEQCGVIRNVNLNKRGDIPSLHLPSSWQSIDDKFVCSFRCAKKAYRKMADKKWSDRLMEKFSAFMARVPGFR